jgi:hypothetical protein
MISDAGLDSRFSLKVSDTIGRSAISLQRERV